MHPAFQGLMTIALGVGGCVGYYFFANLLLDRFVFPPNEFDAEDARKRTRIGLFMFVLAPVVAYLLVLVLVPWVTVGGGFIQDGWRELQGLEAGFLGVFWGGLARLVTGAIIIAAAVVLGLFGFAVVVFAFVLLVAFLRVLFTAASALACTSPRIRARKLRRRSL